MTYPHSSEYRPVYNHSIPSYSSSFSDFYKNRVNSSEPGLGVYSSGLTSNYIRFVFSRQKVLSDLNISFLEEANKILLQSHLGTVTFHLENIKQNLPLLLHINMCMNQVNLYIYKSLFKIISAKYIPNPDWSLYKPWGHKFRKAR